MEQVLSKPATPHCLPKTISSSSAKPQHATNPTPSSSKISSNKVLKSSTKCQKNYDLKKARNKASLQKNGILGTQPCWMTPDLLRNNAKVQPAKPRIYSMSSTIHKKRHPSKLSLKWVPTGKRFRMDGSKWSCECEPTFNDMYVMKYPRDGNVDLIKTNKRIQVWQPKVLKSPILGDHLPYS